MNILVIGSGGREHAIIWALKKSKDAKNIYASPGNGGINNIATSVLINIQSEEDIVEFCKSKNIDLVVIGPEAPLVDGLSDILNKNNIRVFGVSKDAAKLEGSKEYTKIICDKYNIPTAKYESFEDADKAREYLKQQKMPIVIKADGLAAGKGVIIAQNLDEANEAISEILEKKIFGSAGNIVVIEEFLEGEELSVFALCDGKTALYFGSAQDHKAVGEGDTGPNTGGMGTYSPAPIMTKELQDKVSVEIIDKIINAMDQENVPYKGILFAGLMITKDGPKLLEINVRFGDPETQVLMARLDSDLLDLLIAACDGKLLEKEVKLKEQAALCVVMATNGYPGNYEKGSIINNLDVADDLDDVVIFHAGTKKDKDGNYLANGGRVLGVTSIADNVKQAQTRSYAIVKEIDWSQGFYRSDIGWRAV